MKAGRLHDLTPVHPGNNGRKSFTGPIAYLIEVAGIASAIIGHWDIITGLLLMVLPEFERSTMAGVFMVTASTLAIYTG